MNVSEAREWLTGKRSMHNAIDFIGPDGNTALVDEARADAAMLEQAYWILRAAKEGLLNADEAPKDQS